MSEFVKLKELATVITGFPFKGNQYSDAGIRTVRGENVTEGKLRWDTVKCWNQNFEKEQDYLLKPDDIVIGMDGSKVGKNKARVKQGDLPLLLAQRVACVRAKEGNDQVFLYYLINNPRFEQYVFKTQTGSSVPHISKTQIEDYEIPKFDRSIQHKIASVLSALDDKIELNNRINSELEQMAKTLYDYWFVQFDFPNEDGRPYKSSGGKMVFNEVLKRKVPEGWEVKSLYKIADFINGLACQKFRPKNEGDDFLPVIKIREINDGISTKTEKAKVDIPEKNKIDDGDVLFSWSATLDVKIWAEGKGALNQHIFKVVSKEYPRSFYYFEILNYLHHFKMMAELRKTTMGHITIDHLKASFISVPPIDLIKKLDKKIDTVLLKIISNKKQNQELSSLRDWLLPMLMNGQVKIDRNYTATGENLSVAAELEGVYEKSSSLNIPVNKKGFAKQVLAGKIVSEFKDDPNFTDIKFQKIQFLAEHIIEADLNLNYYYQAAGPYDNKFMHSIFNDFRKQKWFDCRNKQFIPQEKQEKIEGYYHGYFASVQKQLDQLFELFYPKSEGEAEIIATLYAVWNNRIIEGRTVADKELIEDFYKWSDRKQQYTEEQVLNGLQWLRTHQMEPKGFGKLIKKAKDKK